MGTLLETLTILFLLFSNSQPLHYPNPRPLLKCQFHCGRDSYLLCLLMKPKQILLERRKQSPLLRLKISWLWWQLWIAVIIAPIHSYLDSTTRYKMENCLPTSPVYQSGNKRVTLHRVHCCRRVLLKISTEPKSHHNIDPKVSRSGTIRSRK